MYTTVATVLALMSVASAQSTVSLILPGFDSQTILGSVIASNAAATTYSLACADPAATDCGIPPSFTFTQGPSTLAYTYLVDDTDVSESIALGCKITSSTEGTCSGTVVGVIGGVSGTSTSTETTTTISGTDLAGAAVTLTDNLTAGAAATTTGALQTSSATGSTTTGTSALKTSTTAKTTGSSSTGSAGGSASTKAASSVSTGGVPMITRAPWAIGAAVLAYAAL